MGQRDLSGTELPVRSDPVRVAVDLETTGLRTDTDAIIEIGAVKFAGARIIDTYQTFVSLSGPLPYRIQRLTGIVPADLRRAPPLASLLPVLRAFIGSAPLVGHSVAFDATFLRRAEVAERNPLIDTYELASMLLPALPSYTLGSVASALGVPASIHHRALADADLARAVFLALIERLDNLDTPALDSLAALDVPSDWTPGPLIRAYARDRQETVSASPFAALLTTASANGYAARGLNPALGEMAIARDDLPTAPARPATDLTPLAALPALHDALEAGGALLCETAPTEEALLAALAAAVRWAAEHGERVVIAAAGSAEMTQVARDLLPRAAARAGIEQPPSVAELDAPSEYLSLRRWFGAAQDRRAGVFPIEVTRGLARLTIWTRETLTGLRADVAMHGGEDAAWERVRAGEEFAETAADCPYRRDGCCFAARAEARAASATIIVTTHAALASSLTGTDWPALDAARVIILDARLFEDALRQTRTTILDPRALLPLLATLSSEPDSSGQRRDLLRIASALLWPETSGRKGGADSGKRHEERAWRTSVERAREAARSFFGALRQALREGQDGQDTRKRDNRGGEQRDTNAVRVDREMRDSAVWLGVEDAWARLATGLTEAASASRAAAGALTASTTDEAGAALGAQTDLLGAARRLDQIRERGGAIVMRDDHRVATWIRPPYLPFAPSNDQSGASAPAQPAADLADAPTLSGMPTRVGHLLAPLWRDGRGVALLGWSLAAAGDFEPLRSDLAMPESTRLAPLTPDYSHQTLLCLPDDVAEPNAPGAQAQLESLIVALAQALDGDVVAVFPSHAMLRGAASGVRRALERHNILALAQGVDGSARQLWQNFDSQERVTLLGAGSFWDGAERRGRAPAAIIIARTPFPAPADPLIATRAEAFSDPQNQFMTPVAALKLRQALGGLAWSQPRRNVVVLFDRRLQTRGYGPTILGALPECSHYQGALSALPEQAAAWVHDG